MEILETGLFKHHAAPEAAPLPPAKVLVVDDVPENIVALEALLAGPDIEVLSASSGAEALEMLLANEVALSLIDVQMPEMDGFELAELMRGSPRTRHVPIIFLTATDRNALRTFRGYEAGAVDFLYKPFDPFILRNKVDVFIQLNRQKLQLARQLEAEQRLLRTNEMFTAVLGHDLRNPLAAVLASAELLTRLCDEPRLLTVVQRIHASGSRMGRMIDQVLDVARARAGQLALVPTPTDILPLCEGVVAEFEALSGTPALKLSARGNTVISVDGDRLAQVLSNLVGNAIRHGDNSQPVRIDIDGQSSHSLRIAVSNAGVIPAAARATLFQAFSGQNSGPSQPRGREQGLGLGLYIANELVSAHGGRIEVRSNETDGTTFEVHLSRLPRLSQA